MKSAGVEIRPDQNGDFDEFVYSENGRCIIHFEMMDKDSLWVGVYDNQGEQWNIRISAKGRLNIVVDE